MKIFRKATVVDDQVKQQHKQQIEQQREQSNSSGESISVFKEQGKRKGSVSNKSKDLSTLKHM